MATFKNADGKPILLKMVKGIQDNKAYLGEVDGLKSALKTRISLSQRVWTNWARFC